MSKGKKLKRLQGGGKGISEERNKELNKEVRMASLSAARLYSSASCAAAFVLDVHVVL